MERPDELDVIRRAADGQALWDVEQTYDPVGNVTSFGYDSLGRLTKDSNAAGGTCLP